MDADLDLLLTAVYVTADDLLPARPGNARRSVTDAEVVTLCVAQAIMGIPSDRRFLAVASKYLRHLFPSIPGQAGYYKRRRRLADTLEWLMGVFASQSPGIDDDLLLVDSTPVECARSRETVKRSAAGRRRRLRVLRQPLAGSSGASGCMRLSLPDGTPRALALAVSQARRARGRARSCSPAPRASGEVTVIADKGYAGTRVRQPRPANSTPRSCVPAAKTSPDGATPRADPAKDRERSSGPARTSSRSSVTAPAPSPASASASCNAS